MREGKPMKVTVSAVDPFTEVVVVDSRRVKVASGGGRHRYMLDPGLYKARFKVGDFTEDRLFEVDDQPVDVLGPHLSLLTPAPLSGTSSTHEYHQAPANGLWALQAKVIGQGSEIRLFARDSHKKYNEGPPIQPWHGLELQRLNGISEADFSLDSECDGNLGYGAMRLKLDPGTYLLTLKRESGSAIQLPVVASEGWCTTVFLDCADTNDHRELDLYGASMIMSRPAEPFNPDDHLLLLAEQAKQSLLGGRSIIDATSFTDMLNEKFSYPILGILAGHLLLLANEPNLQLLRKIVANMENLVPGHPDVLALHIALALSDKSVSLKSIRFAGPPMLRRSWDIILKASETYPQILPPIAEWMQYAFGLSGGQVWLTWQRPPLTKEHAGIGFAGRLDSGFGKAEWPSPLSLFSLNSNDLSPDWTDDNTSKYLTDIAKTVFGSVEGKFNLMDLIGSWSNFKNVLEDSSVAKNPLENAIRRKILGFVTEDIKMDNEEEIRLVDIARDFRVPVSVLINAAGALHQNAQIHQAVKDQLGNEFGIRRPINLSPSLPNNSQEIEKKMTGDEST